MLPGVKVGPQSWKTILKDYRPKCVEVWYRTDWEDSYAEVFAFMSRKNIPAGLHFWGMLPRDVTPNFAFPDPDVRRPSVAMVKKAIDVASRHGLRYVNIHPGSYQLARMNLDRLFMRPIRERSISPREGEKILFENIAELHAYAKRRGTSLLIETLPKREPMHWRNLVQGRLRTQDMLNVGVSVIEKLADRGYFICNDLCHTAMDIISDDRERLYQTLFEKTKRLASQTRLVHINTLPPPFNGTDGHLGIRRQDFTEDVFPSREQMKQLLSLFVDREDIWVIPEPFADQVENTLALAALLEEIRIKR